MINVRSALWMERVEHFIERCQKLGNIRMKHNKVRINLRSLINECFEKIGKEMIKKLYGWDLKQWRKDLEENK